GDFISRINNEYLTASNINGLRSGGAVSLIKAHYDEKQNTFVEDVDPIAMGASSTMYENPVYLSRVIETQGKKIGYLMYNAFRTGPAGFEDKSYDRELIQKVAALKTSAVDEMILDLRYNGGGYLTSAVTLGSLFCPESALSQLFAITRMNDKQESNNSEREKFFHSKDSIGSSNLNLKRLYVIAGSQTASASELIINCLRPYMDVIHIGSTTEGKNVGSLEYTSANFPGYSLHPITSKIFNKDLQSDYRNGFVPEAKNRYDEFDEPQVNMYPIGDENDPYIQLALKDMGLNSSTVPQNTRATNTLNYRVIKREKITDLSGIRL
ncbi:MAG: S41 family peptidase, partial [Bacteroidales bacterium]